MGGGGVSFLPDAHPRSRASPDIVFIGHHSGAVTFRGCYPASQAGFRGGGIFCPPCTASEQEPAVPGVIGTPLHQSHLEAVRKHSPRLSGPGGGSGTGIWELSW